MTILLGGSRDGRSLEKGVDERSGSGASDHDEKTKDQQCDDQGDQPEFLVLLEHVPHVGQQAGLFLLAGFFKGGLFVFAHVGILKEKVSFHVWTSIGMRT